MKKSWIDIQVEVLGKLTAEQDKWLRKNVDLDSGDLRKMSTKEIRKNFPGKPKHTEGGQVATVDDARLIRTLIWQSWLEIKAYELKPLKGNLRSFYYREMGPFLKEHNLFETDERSKDKESEEGPPVDFEVLDMMIDFLSELEKVEVIRGMDIVSQFKGKGREIYLVDKMSKSFDAFVVRKFFRFQDEFEFQDPREAFRIIGRKTPRFIFFTEKEGLFWLCKELANTHGITVVASHGEPGYLTMEYMSDALKARKVKNIEIGALTDYDPWGFNIAKSFGSKLKEPVFGFGVNTTHLTSLKLFTQETIDKKKRDLSTVSSTKKKQVDEWMKLTGGIDGKPYAIHIDNAEFDLIRKAVANWIKHVNKSRKKEG